MGHALGTLLGTQLSVTGDLYFSGTTDEKREGDECLEGQRLG